MMSASSRSIVVWIALILGTIGIVVVSVCTRPVELTLDQVRQVCQDEQIGGVDVNYPYDGSVFPADIVSPMFRWTDASQQAGAWYLKIEPADDGAMEFITYEPLWRPDAADWLQIKKRTTDTFAKVTIVGLTRSRSPRAVSSGSVRIGTSSDPVDAPIFYREVHLPFVDAVKDPSKIRWRFGAVSSPDAPSVILQNMPVCGNCHSFDRKGSLLAMDVDYANSKGSYVMTKVAKEMTLTTSDIITWNDYHKDDGEQTFGLLSQVSPDGRYVVSTVKDKSVFVPREPLAFSQLFFPVKGILCVYDRQTRTFASLKGADDPNYVQSNPTWSPDGREIIFARSKAHDLKDTQGQGKVLLTRDECKEFVEDGKPFKFDLYRIPFNEGRGGVAEPVKGASGNGMSNYFAKYSPDGKWIIFCRANSYMLLQSDSKLFIIPSEGGQEKQLECNLPLMNSWHSFSPNGRWLVFSSKANTPYTQLFLTHIDEQGRSSRPVLLEHFTAADRAANIPEFVNADASAIAVIHEDFLDDYSFVRAGNEFFWAGDADNAIAEYRNALEINPGNATAHLRMGFLLYNVKQQHEEGLRHLSRALAIEPNDPRMHHDYGMAMLHQQKYEEAVRHLAIAVTAMPEGLDKQYDCARMNFALGQALLYKGDGQQAAIFLYKATRLNPSDAAAHYMLSLALAKQGKVDESLRFYEKAVELQPAVDTSSSLHHLLAAGYARDRHWAEAIASENHALTIARAANDQRMIAEATQALAMFKRAAIQTPAPGN